MKIILMMISLSAFAAAPPSYTGDGMPFKYLSSCEIDLNGDGKSDKAMLIEGINGRELIALIATSKGYDTHVVSKGRANMYLFCHTANAEGPAKTHKTTGAFIELVKPESSSVAFLWNKGSFKEVWTGD